RDGAALIEISLNDWKVTGRINLPGKPVAARVLVGRKAALVALAEPGGLAVVNLDNRRVEARMALAGDAGDLDATEQMAVVTLPSKNQLVRVGLPDWKAAGVTETGAEGRDVLFRKDGRTILAGGPARRGGGAGAGGNGGGGEAEPAVRDQRGERGFDDSGYRYASAVGVGARGGDAGRGAGDAGRGVCAGGGPEDGERGGGAAGDGAG